MKVYVGEEVDFGNPTSTARTLYESCDSSVWFLVWGLLYCKQRCRLSQTNMENEMVPFQRKVWASMVFRGAYRARGLRIQGVSLQHWSIEIL